MVQKDLVGISCIVQLALITTDLNRFIIVADTYYRVSVFDKVGNCACIHCFGCNGSTKGQFSSLYGVAISPNGNIHICDHGNHRTQIFST